VLHAPPISFLSDHVNNIFRRTQIMRLLSVYFFATSCYILSLKSGYGPNPQTPVPKHPGA
jgi:hypothetical protein